jgi:hypothetical protein
MADVQIDECLEHLQLQEDNAAFYPNDKPADSKDDDGPSDAEGTPPSRRKRRRADDPEFVPPTKVKKVKSKPYVDEEAEDRDDDAPESEDGVEDATKADEDSSQAEMARVLDLVDDKAVESDDNGGNVSTDDDEEEEEEEDSDDDGFIVADDDTSSEGSKEGSSKHEDQGQDDDDETKEGGSEREGLEDAGQTSHSEQNGGEQSTNPTQNDDAAVSTQKTIVPTTHVFTGALIYW